MKRLLLILVSPLLLLNCDGNSALLGDILDETRRCNEYSVTYQISNSNNCDNPNPTKVYLTSEEFQRLFNLVSNSSPPQCVFVAISPKDGSPLKTGYIKGLESFLKSTNQNGVCN